MNHAIMSSKQVSCTPQVRYFQWQTNYSASLLSSSRTLAVAPALSSLKKGMCHFGFDLNMRFWPVEIEKGLGVERESGGASVGASKGLREKTRA